jgi:Fic family protein
MSYIIKMQKNGENYNYFVKKFSFMGKNYLINQYIGKKPFVSKDKYLLDNLDQITKNEFELKSKHFPQDLVYNSELINKVEYLAIRLNNLIESKKQKELVEVNLLKEFVFNSNNIEGSKLPRAEIEKIFDDKKLDYNNKNEILEVKNSINAYKYLNNDFSFSIRGIKKLYKILTHGLVMETGDFYPSGFRKDKIIVGNETTLNPDKIESEIDNLLDWYKSNKKMYPLKLAFDFHLRYEMIHPFRDGNGRTGRLLMNKILAKNNYPLMVIFKDNKQAYFNSIKQGREGKSKKYYQFMLEQQLKSYELVEQVLV